MFSSHLTLSVFVFRSFFLVSFCPSVYLVLYFSAHSIYLPFLLFSLSIYLCLSFSLSYKIYLCHSFFLLLSLFLCFIFLSSCLCTFPSFSLACCPYNSAMLSFYRSFRPFVIYLNWAFYFTPSAFLFWHSVLFLYSFIKKYFSCVLSSLIVTPL